METGLAQVREKTLSAIIASRVIDAKLTVIFCPNNVVSNWTKNIPAVFSNTQVAQKTWEPKWKGNAARYLVLNFEALQQKNSGHQIKDFLERNEVNFIIVDEVHYAKQRHATNISRRKENLMAMVTTCAKSNPDLAVLAMSATPVINNLQEGKSLMELLRGVELEEFANQSNSEQLHEIASATCDTRYSLSARI